MSSYAILAARAVYAAAGQRESVELIGTGCVALVPISGRAAPNVIDLAPRRAERRKADD